MQKAVLGVLVGTTAFSFSLLSDAGSKHVPDLGVTVAGALLVLSLVLFVFYLDRFTHRLRPVAVARLVARAGRKVITSVSQATVAATAPAQNAEDGPVLVVRSRRPGAIQAIDTRGLVAVHRSVRHPQARDARTKMGGLPHPRSHRDPGVRIRGHPGHTAPTGHARGPAPEHRPAVEAELARLTVTASFSGSVDQDRAATRDRQGIGGPDEKQPAPNWHAP